MDNVISIEGQMPPPVGTGGAGDGVAPTQETTTPNTNPPPQPAAEKLLAGKYKTVEDLEKAYSELSTKLGSKAEPVKIPDQPPPADLGDDAGLDRFVESIGLKPDELGKSWMESGKLSDEHYAKLKAKGIPKRMADEYMEVFSETVTRRTEAQRQQAAELVGGEEQLSALLSWASQSKAAEKDRLNARLSNPETFRGTLLELQHEMSKALGTSKSRPLATTTAAAPIGADGARDYSEAVALREKVMMGRATPAEKARYMATPSELFLRGR
jgi:hypothetical protein